MSEALLASKIMNWKLIVHYNSLILFFPIRVFRKKKFYFSFYCQLANICIYIYDVHSIGLKWMITPQHSTLLQPIFFFCWKLKTKKKKKKKKGCCYPPVTVRRSRRVPLRERHSRGWSGRRRTRDDAERTTAQDEQHRNARTPRSSRPPLRAGHQTREITLAERVLLTRHYEPSLARGFQWVNRSSDFLPDCLDVDPERVEHF